MSRRPSYRRPPMNIRARRWWCGRRRHPDMRVLDENAWPGGRLAYCPGCRTDYVIYEDGMGT